VTQSKDDAPQRGPFEHFASRAAAAVSAAWFFAACVLLVLIWAPSYFVIGDADTWQLVINTATTIVTFLLVALLQNSQHRSALALHQKLDAIADGVADLMEHQLDQDREDPTRDIDDLKAAVGLHHKR
jgi:low affinity Fe/Cu permease